MIWVFVSPSVTHLILLLAKFDMLLFVTSVTSLITMPVVQVTSVPFVVVVIFTCYVGHSLVLVLEYGLIGTSGRLLSAIQIPVSVCPFHRTGDLRDLVSRLIPLCIVQWGRLAFLGIPPASPSSDPFICRIKIFEITRKWSTASGGILCKFFSLVQASTAHVSNNLDLKALRNECWFYRVTVRDEWDRWDNGSGAWFPVFFHALPFHFLKISHHSFITLSFTNWYILTFEFWTI